jgi:serine-type D-Ala-D-Ala carboxypeptidase (penicillin-binding protein 5/6)
MPRRRWILLVVVVAWAGAWAIPPPPPAEAQAPPAKPARAFVLVDADTGRVLAAASPHDPLSPASTTKLMTALVAVEKLAPSGLIAVDEGLDDVQAMRIGIKQGQSWTLDPLLHALLMVSANDAAYALAEAASGNLPHFAADMNATAARYGMADSVFNDPAGFDDAEAFNGGSRVSAFDLAVAARNVLAVPELAAISALPEYRFTGPDGVEHRLLNHNKLLGRYPGAIGLKTGYTQRAGHTFVGAARRDGRTMIVALLGTDDTYGEAAGLLDQGFATPPGVPGTGEALPPVRVRPFQPALASSVVARGAAQRPLGAKPKGDVVGGWLAPVVLLGVAGGGGSAVARERSRRRRRAQAERRRRLAEARRQEFLRLSDPDGWDAGCHYRSPYHQDVL